MEVALQHIVNCFSSAAKNFSLIISLKQPEIQPPLWVAYSPPQVNIDGANPNLVEQFTYLGNIISNDATVSKDLDNRLSKASCSFRRLSKTVWQSHSLRLFTKIKVYRAVIIATVLCSAETWVLYWKQIRLLAWFHQHCLCSILGIEWQDYWSNEEVFKKADLSSIESILLQLQLHWAGQVTRMEDITCLKQSSSASSKKGSVITVLQESIAKTSWRDSLYRRESTFNHGSRRPQTETVGTHQWEKHGVSLRQRGIKPQRKGRESEQHPNHAQTRSSLA